MLFSAEYNNQGEAEDIYASFFEEGEKIPQDGYVRDTFIGALNFASESDLLIEADSKKWKASRMSAVTRTILRLASYELLKTDLPPRVAINEAVELAKEFAEDGSPAFVNGILNRIAKDAGKM